MEKIKSYTKELYDIFDQLTLALLTNLFTVNKGHPDICLFGFDPNRDDHLWVLQTAISLQGLDSARRIGLDIGWLARRRLRKKLGRRLKPFIRSTPFEGCKTIDEILEFMHPAAVALSNDPDFDFGEIYRGYLALNVSDAS